MKPEDFKYCPRCKADLKTTIDGFKCPNCGLDIYPHSSPTASVLIVKKGKLLLTKRGIEPFKGRYGVVGGFLKYAETPEFAALREAKEETGLDVKITELLGIYCDTYGPDGAYTVNIYYLGKTTGGKMKAGDDVSTLEWTDINKLPKPAFKNQIEVFKDLKKWYKKNNDWRRKI